MRLDTKQWLQRTSSGEHAWRSENLAWNERQILYILKKPQTLFEVYQKLNIEEKSFDFLISSFIQKGYVLKLEKKPENINDLISDNFSKDWSPNIDFDDIPQQNIDFDLYPTQEKIDKELNVFQSPLDKPIKTSSDSLKKQKPSLDEDEISNSDDSIFDSNIDPVNSLNDPSFPSFFNHETPPWLKNKNSPEDSEIQSISTEAPIIEMPTIEIKTVSPNVNNNANNNETELTINFKQSNQGSSDHSNHPHNQSIDDESADDEDLGVFEIFRKNNINAPAQVSHKQPIKFLKNQEKDINNSKIPPVLLKELMKSSMENISRQAALEQSKAIKEKRQRELQAEKLKILGSQDKKNKQLDAEKKYEQNNLKSSIEKLKKLSEK